MTMRTVKVLGWGSGTAKITASLDGEQVFSDYVKLEESTDANSSEQTSPTLFTFQIPIDFVGTKKISISIGGATVRFGQIVANYSQVELGSLIYSNGPDVYIDIAEYDSDGNKDPRANVLIDGKQQSPDRLLGKGTWHWNVDPGSTIEHDLIVGKPGLEE
jgi:hypothetical protein